MHNMYPEISKHGGLPAALDAEFENIGSELRCDTEKGLTPLPFSFAVAQKNNRYCQVYLASERKLFLPDFWRNGVCLAEGQTNSITQLALVIHFWLSSNTDTNALKEKFPFVIPSEKATAFDEGRETEYTWQKILADDSREDIRNFVKLAMNDGVVGSLFPFTSLNRLCFSRCTGYPYTYDTPIIAPLADGNYEVRLSDNTIVGSGTASVSLKMVKDNLPADILPAKPGTSEDL